MKSHASSSSSFSCVFERLDRVKNFPIISILPLHFNKLLSLGAGCCCWWLVVLLLRGRRRCDGGVWLVPYLFVPSLPLALVCGIFLFFLFVVSGISNIETHQCCSDLRRHYNNTLHYAHVVISPKRRARHWSCLDFIKNFPLQLLPNVFSFITSTPKRLKIHMVPAAKCPSQMAIGWQICIRRHFRIVNLLLHDQSVLS